MATLVALIGALAKKPIIVLSAFALWAVLAIVKELIRNRDRRRLERD